MKNSLVPAEQESAPPFPAQVGGGGLAPYDPGDRSTPGEEAAGGGAKLRRYWAAAKRFRWLIIILAALGTAGGVTATRFIKPVYEARGAVWISDVTSGMSNRGGAYRPPELLPNGAWVQLIKSFNVVDAVVAKARLFLKPASWQDSVALTGLMPTPRIVPGQYTLTVNPAGTSYTLSEAQRGPVEKGAIGDSVGRSVGFDWVPTMASLQGRRVVRFGVLQPRGVSVGLINQLDVGVQENSNFLTLTLTGPEKWPTADLLNLWMQQFVSTAAVLRKQNLVEEATNLDAQRAAAAQNLRKAEAALQGFSTQTSTLPGADAGVSPAPLGMGGIGPSTTLATQFFARQAVLDSLENDRQALLQVAAAGRKGTLQPDQVAQIPAVSTAPSLSLAVKDLVDKQAKLDQFKQSYTSFFKPMQALQATVQNLRTQVIPQLASQQAELLAQRESQLSRQLHTDSLQLQKIPARTIQEGRLRRDLATADALWNNVETRYETARLGAESTVPDVSILDPALPAANPQRNVKVMLVLGGFAGALALGVAIALLLDMLDHRFRYPEQITDELRLDVLGAIPAVPKPEEAAKDPDAMLQSVEAFRGLRMSLHHAFSAPPVLVTITSPGAGDGKSMIASNLALSFAEAGYRTLLIDGDIRRGKLHSVFGVERRPGLLDYLAGDVDAVGVMRDVPVHGRLTVIPSGTRRHRGPELLTSARLPALLNMMRPKFDVILVDSAPLAAGVDAYALSVATGNLVLVMRTGHTDRRMAKAKMKYLERLPVRVLGAVVNAVPGTGLYAEYSYLYGYGPEVDTDADTPAAEDRTPVLQGVSSSGT